jgi:hypothetical protein
MLNPANRVQVYGSIVLQISGSLNITLITSCYEVLMYLNKTDFKSGMLFVFKVCKAKSNGVVSWIGVPLLVDSTNSQTL